jgi:hypothetical protein
MLRDFGPPCLAAYFGWEGYVDYFVCGDTGGFDNLNICLLSATRGFYAPICPHSAWFRRYPFHSDFLVANHLACCLDPVCVVDRLETLISNRDRETMERRTSGPRRCSAFAQLDVMWLVIARCATRDDQMTKTTLRRFDLKHF